MTRLTTGPKGLPISGNLLAFRKDPLGFLRRAAEQYGDVVHIRFGPNRHVYLLNDPEHIKEVLVAKQASFRKAKGLQTAKAVVGEGILTSEGAHHLRQRRLMQPFFRKDRVNGYAGTMVSQTEKLLDTWKDGQERLISDDMMELTLSIITETMFGTNLTEGVAEIGRAVEKGMRYVSRKASSFIDLPESFPSKSRKDFEESAKLLDDVIFSIIEQRRKNPQEHAEDLLSMLLAARDEEDGSGMTDRQVRDEVTTIFLAGHETTANTLSWTWYLLSQHPEAERKFADELDAVLGGRTPTVDDVDRLTYTQQIIQESMRLYPAAWAINREAVEDVEIGGNRFKQGDTLMMSQYVMHRNPKYYADPDEFRPERFAGDFLKTLPQFAYFPFGGGPRICIGNNFALLEAALILATIGSRFRLRLAPGHPPVVPEPLITLRPRDGLRMIVETRRR